MCFRFHFFAFYSFTFLVFGKSNIYYNNILVSPDLPGAQKHSRNSTREADTSLLEERVQGKLVSLPRHFPSAPHGFCALSLQRLQFWSEGKYQFNSYIFIFMIRSLKLIILIIPPICPLFFRARTPGLYFVIQFPLLDAYHFSRVSEAIYIRERLCPCTEPGI